MLACLAPDIDGIFLAIFWRPDWFQHLHHTFGHNIFYAAAVGALTAVLANRGRMRMFGLGMLMVLLHFVADMLTAADWAIPFFWPLSKTQYNIPVLLGVPAIRMEAWDFALKVVVQWILKAGLLTGTVIIYIKYRRTFLELISSNLDRFLTNFAILPFQKRCDTPECSNRAHYHCENCDSDRCIRHCTINRNLTITCDDCSAAGGMDMR